MTFADFPCSENYQLTAPYGLWIVWEFLETQQHAFHQTSSPQQHGPGEESRTLLPIAHGSTADGQRVRGKALVGKQCRSGDAAACTEAAHRE